MVIPEVQTSGLLGDLKAYVSDPLVYLQTQKKIQGDIFRFRVGNRRLIFVNHPDYIDRVLQSNHRNYRKNLAYRKLRLLLGDGLFTSEGDYWLKQRRLAAPAFRKEQIDLYVKWMEELTTEQLGRWDREIDLTHEMTDLTLKIVTRCLLGMGVEDEARVVEEHLPFALKHMLKIITSPTAAPHWLPTADNLKFRRSRKKIDEQVYKLIDIKMGEGGKDDLLSALIAVEDQDTGEKMSRQQLRDEVITFFLAGHETSAIAAQWVLLLLERNPYWKEKIRSEIGDGSLEQLLRSETLERCIKEGMRLKTPIWILGREALGKDQLGGYSIQPGDSIIFSPYMVHRHMEFWMDTDEFNPDRFKEDQSHRFAYFPFGGGPRVCIGNHFAMAELKIIIGKVLLKGITIPEEDPGHEYSITLRPGRAIHATL